MIPMRTSPSILVIVFLALALPSTGYCDEAPMPYLGTTLGPFIPTEVQMVEEEVWMEVGPHRIDVRAEFTYFNPAATESIQVCPASIRIPLSDN